MAVQPREKPAESVLERMPLAQKAEYINFLRENPVFAAKELLGLELAPHERIMLRGMWNHKWVLNVLGRGCGKCAHEDALIYDANIEEFITHKEAFTRYAGKEFSTLALDNNYKITKAQAKIEPNGSKECVEVKLRSGRSIKVTRNHPLLKIDGWEPAGNLKAGDRVATARSLPEAYQEVPRDIAKLVGYLLGDGGTTHYISFTNDNPIILKDFTESIVRQFHEHSFYETPSGKATTIRVASKEGRWGCREGNLVLVWAKTAGLFGVKSLDKEIPNYVYTWNNEAIGNLLGAYFDCDGSVDSRGVVAEYYSSSRRLLEGTQRLLLRLGVQSSLRSKKTNYKGKISYRLSISGSENLKIFKEKINSISGKFDRILLKESNPNTDTIPKEIYTFYPEYKSTGTNGVRYKKQYSPSRAKLKQFGQDCGIPDAVAVAESDIFWDEVEEIIETGECTTYAVEVSEFHNYLVDTAITHNTFMNAVFGVLRCLLYSGEKIVIVGPSFRQSIFVFNEAERILQKSIFFQQALIDKPKHHANEYAMIFRNGSTITALPLGVDGSKIRGTRATVIIVDEAAQVPSDIIDQAIIPFMTTKKNPMAKYLGVEEEDSENVLVFSSSAYYQFNHLYEKFIYWLQKVEEKDDKYFVTKFNYYDTPEGFIDIDVVELQRKTSPDIIFRMEYLAEFPKDSMGFFPASLVHACTDRFVAPLYEGKRDKEYVMGLDPARSDDNFGIVILELNGDIRNVVRVEAHNNKKMPDMKMHIYNLLERFNVVRIGCDKFGGGRALADLFEEGQKYISSRTGKLVQVPPILVIDDKETEYLHGRRILELIVFSSQTISEMNFDLKARMENGFLRIPASPYCSNEVDEDAEAIFEEINNLKMEMTNIEVEKTASDYLKFVVPEGQKKDRYSALMIANHAADHFVLLGTRKPELPIGFWGGS